MKLNTTILALLLSSLWLTAQDLTMGLMVNDLTLRPMQPLAKPAYLGTVTDPSFGTTIRRISNAAPGSFIVPMYSTIQPWNTDESLMILYEEGGRHRLLDGRTYQFIRYLNDINPDDIENIFWDFDEPAILYYLDRNNNNFIRYNVNTQNKTTLFNVNTVTNNCSGFFTPSNDVQMMSWDSDIFSFRCNNERTYYYRISTGTLVEFDINTIGYTAPMPGPSGNLFYHRRQVYNAQGNLQQTLNESSTEHSCMGRLSNGHDAYFAIAFAQGPSGGCVGDVIAHDMTTGQCFPLISQSQGYDYPQSGTHLSALTHKNTEGGWLSASMMGYDQNGQELLDQELVIVKADQGNVKVCRIGHHRSDENEFDYWGEPHAAISPTGTRVLFGSDWSGAQDGQSVDSYVVELPAYNATVLAVDDVIFDVKATVENQHIALHWQKNITDQHAHFEIEHSLDGRYFTSIGKNTKHQTTFKFHHTHPYKGVNHYRIKQVLQSGETTYSNIVTIQYHEQGQLFKYNSSTKELSFNDFNEKEIFIYTIDGRLVFQQKNQGKTLMLDFLNTGIFTIQVMTNGQVETERIGVF